MTGGLPMLANLHSAKRLKGPGTSNSAKQSQSQAAVGQERRTRSCETKPIRPAYCVKQSQLRGPVGQNQGLVCETKPIGRAVKWSVSAVGKKGCARKRGLCLCEKQSQFAQPGGSVGTAHPTKGLETFRAKQSQLACVDRLQPVAGWLGLELTAGWAG
jgi:hypothetical protein